MFNVNVNKQRYHTYVCICTSLLSVLFFFKFFGLDPDFYWLEIIYV